MPQDKNRKLTYKESGVDQEREDLAMVKLADWVRKTFTLNPQSKVLLDLGYFANVIDLGLPLCIALATDSVGTKIIMAEIMDRFDTIGIDCIAMNVNDIICLGATPVAFVDCIAIGEPDERVINQLGQGLYRGAELAGVSIPGGELAQVGELLQMGEGRRGLDIVGTCIGTVKKEEIILGGDITEGDAVIGILGDGLHSNGYTLARKTLFDAGGFRHDQHMDDLGETLGEALLRPTPMYSKPVMEILSSGVPVKGMANITGGGVFNIARFDSDMGFILDDMPEPPPLFRLIQEVGKIEDEEMYAVFNMGIGYCFVIPDDSGAEDTVLRILSTYGMQGQRIGCAAKLPEAKGISLPGLALASHEGRLIRSG
ncbi:phosphoribosylformylglycinamidine cyclo-ligase [Acidobacteriota bacterium]